MQYICRLKTHILIQCRSKLGGRMLHVGMTILLTVILHIRNAFLLCRLKNVAFASGFLLLCIALFPSPTP